MTTCKRFYLLIFLALASTQAFSQIRSDFTIADSALKPSFDFDDKGNIHLVWGNDGLDDWGTWYCLLDSLGNIKLEPRRISKSPATLDPKIVINKDKAACIWEDQYSINVFHYSYGIQGKILKDGLDFGDEIQIDDGDLYHPPIDALRRRPQIVWHSDSVLYAVWEGQGHQSFASIDDIYAEKLLMPLQKSGDNYPLNNNLLKSDEWYPSIIRSQIANTYQVIWSSNDTTTGIKLVGRSLSEDFKPLTPELVFVDLGKTKYTSHPSVFLRGNGNIIIAWEKDTANYKSNIFLQEFSVDGTPIGDANQINDKLANGGSEVSADVDENDNVIVAWEEGKRIGGQRYGKNLNRIGMNFYLQTRLGGGNIFPHVRLRNHKIYTAWSEFLSSSSNVSMSIFDFDNPVSVHRDPVAEPTDFKLSQNWPNPFNPTTQLQYTLGESRLVSLKVYDIIGREVSTLVNEVKPAGSYTVSYDASLLSGGIYYCRIISGDFSSSIKMVLVK